MIKVGVIGAGHLGKFHLNNWAVIEGIELVGFCDTDDENAKIVSEKYGLTRYTDHAELMDACDAVDIVAPTTSHFELCLQINYSASASRPWAFRWCHRCIAAARHLQLH